MKRERLNELLTTMARPSKENDELQDIFSGLEDEMKELRRKLSREYKARTELEAALTMIWRVPEDAVEIANKALSKREGD